MGAVSCWPLFCWPVKGCGRSPKHLVELKDKRPLMPSVFTSREGTPLGTWAEHSIFRWTVRKRRPRPSVRMQRDWKRLGLRAEAPPGIGDLWLWLRLRFLDDEGCFANGADNWVAAQVVKHVPAVFTKSLCSALFHNYEAISNRMNRWPFSCWGKGCGRSPFHMCGHGDETGAPAMPCFFMIKENHTGHLG
jgi:hypothetical protein